MVSIFVGGAFSTSQGIELDPSCQGFRATKLVQYELVVKKLGRCKELASTDFLMIFGFCFFYWKIRKRSEKGHELPLSFLLKSWIFMAYAPEVQQQVCPL